MKCGFGKPFLFLSKKKSSVACKKSGEITLLGRNGVKKRFLQDMALRIYDILAEHATPISAGTLLPINII